MAKICVSERFYGDYTYTYSAYSGQQVYDITFNDYEGKTHSPSGVTSNPNDPNVSSNYVSFCQTNYGLNLNYVPTEMRPVTGRNSLNCSNEGVILTFKSYVRKGSICLEKGCDPTSCKITCASSEDGFCCIDHSLTDRLLQVLG